MELVYHLDNHNKKKKKGESLKICIKSKNPLNSSQMLINKRKIANKNSNKNKKLAKKE
jgi:hypothetical protein